MRKAGEDPRSNEKRITATTRQLESMIRLSEAHARMRLSPFVELDDVKEAYRLMREAINTSARDPTTGEIDMGLLDTGIGRQQRKLRGDMRRAVLALLDGAGATRGVEVRQLWKLNHRIVREACLSENVPGKKWRRRGKRRCCEEVGAAKKAH